MQRRATPHPSELKVMKKVIEVRRSEAHAAKADPNLALPNSDLRNGVTTDNVGRGWGRQWGEAGRKN